MNALLYLHDMSEIDTKYNIYFFCLAISGLKKAKCKKKTHYYNACISIFASTRSQVRVYSSFKTCFRTRFFIIFFCNSSGDSTPLCLRYSIHFEGSCNRSLSLPCMASILDFCSIKSSSTP